MSQRLARLLSSFALLLALAAPSAAILFDTDPPRPPVPVALKRVLDGLDQPTSIAHAGDDRLFLTLLPGRIVIVAQGVVQPTPFLDIHGLLTSGGEQGLLGLAFHPRYAENGLFFVCYTDTHGAVTVARYAVSGDPQRADPASGKVLLSIPKPFGNHNGGQLQFGPDGLLYVSVGDGGGAGGPECFSQKESSLLGKILRLDVDAQAALPPYYGIPPGNPIPGSPIWASGLRNAWRFSFDRREALEMWIADVGQGEREEVNVVPGGGTGGFNFGWKPMEGSRCFSNQECLPGTPPCGSPLFTAPALEYSHDDGDCSVTGGYVARAPSLPHVWGAYVFGDLCSGRLWAADRQGTVWRIRQLPQRAEGVSTFGEDRAGNLWVATIGGALFQLVPQHPVDTVGLFEATSARFLLKDLHQDGPEDRVLRFGTPGAPWVPLSGDWNGDGRTGVGFWDAEEGVFRLKNALRRGRADVLFAIAAPAGGAALPLSGDWDGDGRDTVGFYVPATSTFYLTNRLSGSSFPLVFSFGTGGLPVAGDWDGDGKDSVGLYLPGRGLFLLRNALSAGPASLRFRFGTANAGWLPIAGDWDGDGKDSVGLQDPVTGTFRLLDTPRTAPADRTIRFGTPGGNQKPLSGEW